MCDYLEEGRIVPIAPGPIDFGRRRIFSHIYVKRLQCTLPIKRKSAYSSQHTVFQSVQRNLGICIPK